MIAVPIQLNDLRLDTVITTPTQGDILFRGASKWNNLATGAAGQVLTSGGAAANPSWTTLPTVDLSSRVAKAGDTMTGALVVNPAGGFAGNIFDAQVGGASKARINETGTIVVAENVSFSNWGRGLVGPNGGVINFSGGTGNILLGDGTTATPSVDFHNGVVSIERTGKIIGLGQFRNSFIGSAANDVTQDSIRIQPSGALAANWRPLAIYGSSGATTPVHYFNSNDLIVSRDVIAGRNFETPTNYCHGLRFNGGSQGGGGVWGHGYADGVLDYGVSLTFNAYHPNTSSADRWKRGAATWTPGWLKLDFSGLDLLFCSPGAADADITDWYSVLNISGAGQLKLPSAPPASANYGLLSLGSGGFAGSAGHFAGSASGTLLAGNAASGFAGNLLDLQIAGVRKFSISATGALFMKSPAGASTLIDIPRPQDSFQTFAVLDGGSGQCTMQVGVNSGSIQVYNGPLSLVANSISLNNTSATLLQHRFSHLGSASNDTTQDSVRIQPSGALAANWRPLAIYAASSNTRPWFYIDSTNKLQFAAANSVEDVNLYRASTGILKTDGTFFQNGSAVGILGYLQTNGNGLASTVNLNPGISVYGVGAGVANMYGMDLGHNGTTGRYRTRIFAPDNFDVSIAFHANGFQPTTQSGFTDRYTFGNSLLTLADTVDIAFNTTTGSKLGTATTQKIAFWNATPIVQPAAVADASGGVVIDIEARAALNALLAKIRTTGLIAT